MKRKPLINCAKTALRYKFEGLFDSNLTEDEITLVLQEIGFYMFKFEISPESKRAEESNRIRKEAKPKKEGMMTKCAKCGLLKSIWYKPLDGTECKHESNRIRKEAIKEEK